MGEEEGCLFFSNLHNLNFSNHTEDFRSENRLPEVSLSLSTICSYDSSEEIGEVGLITGS